MFAGVLGLLMVLNVGAAFASHGDNAPPFAEAEFIADGGDVPGPPPANVEAALTTPGSIPVGTALGFSPTGPNDHPALIHMSVRTLAALANNPNCPLHYLP